MEPRAFRITEAHPKALMTILRAQGREIELDWIPRELDEHQRDACIAAFAAWSMWSGAHGWVDLYQREPESVQPFGIPVSYWMPIP